MTRMMMTTAMKILVHHRCALLLRNSAALLLRPSAALLLVPEICFCQVLLKNLNNLVS